MAYIKLMGRLMVALILGVVFVVVVFFAMTYDRRQVRAALEDQGYQRVSIAGAWINRAPIQCSGEDTSIFTYSAVRNGRSVTGFACYRGMLWGVANWDD